jgi:hypothetical protein
MLPETGGVRAAQAPATPWRGLLPPSAMVSFWLESIGIPLCENTLLARARCGPENRLPQNTFTKSPKIRRRFPCNRKNASFSTRRSEPPVNMADTRKIGRQLDSQRGPDPPLSPRAGPTPPSRPIPTRFPNAQPQRVALPMRPAWTRQRRAGSGRSPKHSRRYGSPVGKEKAGRM